MPRKILAILLSLFVGISSVKANDVITVNDSISRIATGSILKDSQNDIGLNFKPKQLIFPLSLVAVGTVGVYWKDFHKLNREIQKGMDNLRGDHYLHFDDWIQYLPAVGYMGLGFYKKERKLEWKERVAVEATAYLSMAALVNIAKYSFREQRPSSTRRNSFPSGHTATAFTGAELIRHEFGWGFGSAAYVVATGVAFMRLYNNSHWLNDVIAGAGIGILSAQIGYWMLPLYRKWFHWEKKDNKSALITVPAYSQQSFSLNLMYLF
ncbi:MAG: phosphatase PAP2 family protein [Muribaculaceae bacterium]|nr:phosphatase PAP2 family protein [Muribaculaceae bacterium]